MIQSTKKLGHIDYEFAFETCASRRTSPRLADAEHRNTQHRARRRVVASSLAARTM